MAYGRGRGRRQGLRKSVKVTQEKEPVLDDANIVEESTPDNEDPADLVEEATGGSSEQELVDENADETVAGDTDAAPGDNMTNKPAKRTKPAPAKKGKASKKNPQDYVWPTAKEDELITLYRENRHLYDKTAPGYGTLNKREVALEAFSEKLGVPTDVIDCHLQSLRSQYSRITRDPPSGSGARNLTPRNNYILSRMAFIDVHLRGRKGRSSLETSVVTSCQSSLSMVTNTATVSTAGAASMTKTSSSPAPNTTASAATSRATHVGGDEEGTPSTGDTRYSLLSKRFLDLVSTNDDPKTSDEVPPKQSTSTSDVIVIPDEGADKQPAVKKTKKGKGFGKNRSLDQTSEISCRLDERTNAFKEFTQAFIESQQKNTTVPVPTTSQTPIQMWSQVLASKIERMPVNIQDEFMVHVDEIAVLALKGVWSRSPKKFAKGFEDLEQYLQVTSVPTTSTLQHIPTTQTVPATVPTVIPTQITTQQPRQEIYIAQPAPPHAVTVPSNAASTVYISPRKPPQTVVFANETPPAQSRVYYRDVPGPY